MQLIAADIGNSSTKIAVDHAAKDDRWCQETVFRNAEPIDLTSIQIGDEPAFWSVCSVNQSRQQRLRDIIAADRPNDQFYLIEPDDVDLETNVQSRTQLGRDRLVAAWMAVQLTEHSGPLIVIDAGTAVTVDLVDQDLVFQGGAIFPGAESNLRQLTQNTDALPDLQSFARHGRLPVSLNNSVGKSTTDAILLGVYTAQVAAIQRLAQSLAQPLPTAATIFTTGGGIIAIERELDESWQHVPDLVLRGARGIGRKLIRRPSSLSPHANG